MDENNPDLLLALLIVMAFTIVENLENDILYNEFYEDIISHKQSLEIMDLDLFPNFNKLANKFNELKEKLKKEVENYTIILPHKYKVFRTRQLDNKIMDSVFKNTGIDTFLFNTSENGLDYIFPLLQNAQKYFDKTSPVFNDLKERIDVFKDVPFQGFDAKGSTAPPSEFATSQRLSPKQTSYLYVAQNIETAISEIRPTIGELVSVAEGITTKSLKILDLSNIEFNKDKRTLCDVIAFKLQVPKYNKDSDERYFPTQVISQYVHQELNFDGIKYRSSLNKSGINFVIFNPDNVEFINSKIYALHNIHIEVKQLADILNENIN
ncbi:MAG: hypothetical protein ATN31_07120 [Candidatus Epulonipiscioides saccharophilum]|nr:MAG: hypothetical protein ATN31_07120 [Epulopiscium sp. AS2M-Bin001]